MQKALIQIQRTPSMAHISKEELIKLSAISHIKIYDHEIEQFAKQIESVLVYAECLNALAGRKKEMPLPKKSNVMRADSITPSCPDTLLAQAPSVEEHYFVVPAILKHHNQ